MRIGVVLLLGLASCAPARPAPPCRDPGRPEGGLRVILEDLRNAAERLRNEGRYAEARATYEEMIDLPLIPPPPRLGCYELNLKGWAQIGIAECWEAEGRWDEALAAYRDSHLKFPVRGECGEGNYEQYRKELENIARCIERLEKP